MRAYWDPVTLTRSWWHGPEPKRGDGLRTRTGRRYVILAVRGKRLDCMVIPPEETIDGMMFDWSWGPRRRRTCDPGQKVI